MLNAAKDIRDEVARYNQDNISDTDIRLEQ